MNLGEIRLEVENLVQDDSYTNAEKDALINEAVQTAAAMVMLPGKRTLTTIDTETSQAYTTVTGTVADFSGILRRVKNSDGGSITIYPSLELLLDAFPTMDEEGVVEGVALDGNTLWYQKIPASAETLTILVTTNPDTLTADTDSPSDFPTHLHRKLFVNGTAYIMYNEIEEGQDGDKTNTNAQHWLSFNEQNRHSGIVKLREWISVRKINHISGIMNV